MIDLTNLEREQKKVKLWNITYILCNIVPIIFFALILVTLYNLAFAVNEQDYEAVWQYFDLIIIFSFPFIVPLVLEQYVQYRCKLAKIEFNNAYSDTIVKSVLEHNAETTVDTKENSFTDPQKVAKMGFAKAGNNIVTGGYFNGEYGKKTFEGAYVHTYWRKGHANLVLKIIGMSDIGRIKRRYYYGFFSGVMADVNNIKYDYDPIVIYDKKYKKKNFIYEFDDSSIITTGNEEFDSKFIVKTANPTKALEYLTEERIQAFLETRKLNMPQGFHLRNKNMSLAVRSKDLKFSFSIFKKINYDEEAAKLKSAFEVYYKLLDVL